MSKQEMYNMIQQEDERVQANKTKRNLKLFIGSVVVFFVMNMLWFKNDIINSLISSIVCAGLYFLSGILFWVPFIEANSRENQHLQDMKKQYQDAYNETWL